MSNKKVALVTGGSRGIGAAIVKRLARDGADVAFTYSSSEAQAREVVDEVARGGGRAIALKADNADATAVQAAVAQTVEELGGLDVLVNNAGVLYRSEVEDVDLGEFDRSLAVNVRAMFVATQAAARHMGQGGRVINIGSIVGERSVFPGTSVYAMTKAAVAGLTRGLAHDLGPRGITVNNVQPGPTVTDMNNSHHDVITPMLALKRMGQPEEIASFVAYLAGPEAGFVTGASLSIDGGYTA